jgi:cyclophilin family peptidyl-prolyl cis-trans isomerase/HEAT repeat protein
MLARRCAALALVASAACDPTSSSTAGSASPSATGTAAPTDDARVSALRRAEVSRRPADVRPEDLSSRDPAVRRAAVRALAQIRAPSGRDALIVALSDEDEEIVAWAAYGLGETCEGSADATVSALVAAQASLSAREGEPPKTAVGAPRAIARAVGRCGGAQSEATLSGWALQRGPHTLDAVYGLSDLVEKRKRLREDTYAALLELAAGDAGDPPIPEALHPFGRIDFLTPSVVERTREVAKSRLETASPARIFAVKALGRTDEAAVPALADVLEKADRFDPAERAEAARMLARFGRDGQKALRRVLPTLVPDTSPAAATTLVGPTTGVLVTVLESMTEVSDAGATLKQLATLAPPPEAPEAIARRLSWIRCRAAVLVAERDFAAADLRACDLGVPADKRTVDPLPSSIGARAVVAAIGVDGVKIEGKRLEVWRAYAREADVRTREAALELLVDHAEVADAAGVLAEALASEEPGLVSVAAEVIAKKPARGHVEPPRKKKGDKAPEVPAGGVHPRIAELLVQRLAGDGPTRDLEALGTVIDAVAALELEAAKPEIEKHCGSPWPSVRDHAQKALTALAGTAASRCEAREGEPVPVELDRMVTERVTLKLRSDAGELVLEIDPSLAPVAATRAVDLAKNDFYDGMIVHRVVPGFVSQFGSPSADGYGGVKGLPSLPCETAPVPYAPLSIGVALAGRDTGSSQLFVTHVPTPHLDGRYAWLGTASGPWNALVDGDRIHDVVVVSP